MSRISGVVLVLSVILLTELGLTACNSNQVDIAGPIWVLESYQIDGNHKTAVQETKVTAVFNSPEGKVSGSGGCNSYSAAFTIEGAKMTITQLGSTKIACQSPVGEQESSYFNLLKTALTYKIDGEELTISSSNGSLVFGQDAPNKSAPNKYGALWLLE